MDFQMVMPSIHPEWTARCLDSMGRELRDRLIVIDNTVQNRGVAASWNVGVDAVLEEELDFLVICSAAVRFGAYAGRDFVGHLEVAMAETARDSQPIAIEAGHGIGWHLIAFPRRVFELVGRFDENFWPAYYEDDDFGRRVSLGFGLDPPYWTKVSVDVAIAGFSHGIDLGGVSVDNARLRRYYVEKWGGPKGQETFELPFGTRPLDYWPEPLPTP